MKFQTKKIATGRAPWQKICYLTPHPSQLTGAGAQENGDKAEKELASFSPYLNLAHGSKPFVNTIKKDDEKYPAGKGASSGKAGYE